MSSGCGDVLSLADLQTAKKHQIFEAEVITGKAGGTAGGADIDFATNQVTGQVQKTMPAVLRDVGFFPASWDFAAGGTLTEYDRNKVAYDPVSQTWYSYAGTFPVTVPAGFNPVGSADWKPQTDPTVRTDLASTNGFDMVGAPVGGTLRTVIQYVTPEQYGAIGDGALHPLSERFSTLAAAQAVYPFVTSLTQSIDWAACQKADNDNRGVRPIRCPFYAKYHLGDNFLEIGEKSQWYGNENPTIDRPCTTLIREGSTGSFGKNAIVRVMDSADAGSSDEFVRGIVFKGFYLSRNRPRRFASKGEGSIGFHANFAIRADVDVAISGCEYGFFGYGCWGLSGRIRVDSCHKAVWLDPDTATPEHTSPGGSITALDLRVEIDASVFGLVLRHCQYSKLSGWVEGMIANTPTYPIYDYANETAIAATLYGCDGVDLTSLGIEAWQGVQVYDNSSTVSANIKWNQDYKLLNTTGKHGPYQAMAELMGVSELFTLPASNNSYFYALNGGLLTLRNMTGDMSTSDFASTFLITTDSTGRFCMENCGIYFGSSRLIHPENGYWKNISFTNDRFFKNYMVPNGYTWVGEGRCQSSNWVLAQIGTNGVFTFTPPAGWAFRDISAYTLGSGPAAQQSAGIIGMAAQPGDGGVSLQTNYTGAAGTYSLYYKATLEIVK